MPIYEYECNVCGNVDEHFMRMADPDPTSCTKCNGPVRKKISNTSFALKGEGWYTSDYKPKSKEAVAESNALKGVATDTPAVIASNETALPPVKSPKTVETVPKPTQNDAVPAAKSVETKSKD